MRYVLATDSSAGDSSTLRFSTGTQVTLTAQNITVQVTTSQPWTDSGLDLQSRDVVEISAGSPSDRVASGVPACDPKGVTSVGSTTANLPLSTAPEGALIARLHAQGAAPLLVGASNQFHIVAPSHLMLGMNISGTLLTNLYLPRLITRSGFPSRSMKYRGTWERVFAYRSLSGVLPLARRTE